MTDPPVQAQRLPGIGWRFTIPADQGRHVMVVVEDRGPRYLMLLDPRLDEALTTVRLPAERAFVLAALLTGARFTLVPSDEPADAGADDPLEVVVETLLVTSGSPAVGLTQDEAAPRLGAEAALLGVIDDRTPELVDPEGGRAIQQGDKLVAAARRGALESLRGAV
jgi:K+/H+ antiporter YhaU regulatory subunit KhtT